MVRRRLFDVAGLILSLAITLPATAQYYNFGRNKIQYEDFDWQVLKTEHFDIHYYPEMQELAEHGAFFAEEAFAELQNKFDFTLNHRIPMIFYSSNLHFKQTNTTPGFIPDGVGGFFEFLKGRVVIPANGNIHRFRRVIRHEMVHVFTFVKVMRTLKEYRIPNNRIPPLWFTEGLAEYWSGEADYQHEMMIRDALFSNYLVPLESMYRISGTFLMYKQGEAICRFVSETYGEEKLLELIDNFWKDADFRDVMSTTLREDFGDIAARWQGWLKEQYYPMLEDIVPQQLSMQPLTPHGISSKPTYYRFSDGTRKIYFVANRTGYTNLYEREVDSLYHPVGKEHIVVKGERNNRFEAFHFFESRTSVSDDGKLAFVTKSGESDAIHIYDLHRDRIVGSYNFDDLIALYSPSWNPEGTEIAFSSIDRTGFSDLYIYDLTSNVLEKLTNDAYDERDPAWSPDGETIAFSSDRTTMGENGAYNLFTYDLERGTIRYATYGDHYDFSPRWSPDGTKLLYTSARKDSTGKYGGQDIWALDMTADIGAPPYVASATHSGGSLASGAVITQRTAKRLTNVATAAFDPVWTNDDHIIISSFENHGFSLRALSNADSLLSHPRSRLAHEFSGTGDHWSFGRLGEAEGADQSPYQRKYQLDVAQGQVSQNQLYGTNGGALLGFSDLLGNDYWYVTLFNTARSRSTFLQSMNVSITRIQFHKRANYAYGLYRYGGERYDRTDPDAPTVFPYVFETMYGGFGSVSYPISMFKRIQVSTSLSYSDKEIPITSVDREALLLSNSLAIVHDNTLYGMNGPVQGWRGNLSVGYTTDIRYSNVNYFTVMTDLRHYLQLGRHFTLASRATAYLNEGREARLFLLGGSWDLRGYNLFSVRGQKMWFTSHEFRFPILNNPTIILPILAPFGVANLRGALFFDAAHAWNDGYNDRESQLLTGETLGATGLGFRINLFGGLVLRYDIGYRYRNDFKDRSNGLFKQFFFGYDF